MGKKKIRTKRGKSNSSKEKKFKLNKVLLAILVIFIISFLGIVLLSDETPSSTKVVLTVAKFFTGAKNLLVGAVVTTLGLKVQAVPQVSDLTLNTTDLNNQSYENITLYFNVSDIDADDIKNITNWKNNGSSITILNMPFEGVSDSVINATKDYSGLDLNGSEQAGVTFNAGGGYDGFSDYEFDGEDDFISILEDSAPNGAYSELGKETSESQFTIAAWINTVTNAGAGTTYYMEATLIEFRTTAGGGSLKVPFYLGLANNKLALGRQDGGATSELEVGSATINDGSWKHVAVTVNGLVAKFYVDGELDATRLFTEALGDASLGLDNSYFTIGARITDAQAADSFFNGSIDDLVIYNRTLTAKQIKALFENKTQVIAYQETHKDDTWSACITPNDRTADGDEVCSGTTTILPVYPALELMSPADESVDSDGRVIFNYNFSGVGEDRDYSCSLYFNEVKNATDYIVFKDTVQSFVKLALPEDAYTWNVSCTYIPDGTINDTELWDVNVSSDWWNNSFAYRTELNVTTTGVNKVNITMLQDALVELTTIYAPSIRVVWNNEVEIKMYNQTGDSDTSFNSEDYILFDANDTDVSYYLYWSNADVPGGLRHLVYPFSTATSWLQSTTAEFNAGTLENVTVSDNQITLSIE